MTVRIPKELDQAIALASRRLQRTPSEIVRMALRQFLSHRVSNRRPAERVGELIGSLDSRIPDLAEKHRDYILESLRNER
jgi:metal-responsive CopG/Arc/MetJ family transcriptional regulator